MIRGKKYVIIIILGMMICFGVIGKTQNFKVSASSVTYKYAKDETLLRASASSSAEVSIVVVKGTKLKCTSSVTKGDGTIYDKVEIVADGNYGKGHKGYVLRRQLTTKVVKSEKRLMYIKNKTNMVREAMRILNTKTKYNLKAPYRVGGYYNVRQDGKYVYDCSSFCSTLMNRTFGVNMIQKDKEKVSLSGKQYYNVWTTYTYLNEAKKTNGMFKVVDRVTTPGKSIDKSKLQIGDLILGDAKKIRKGVNHIMFYAGDGYIIHAKGSGVVRERLSTDYYTRLETSGNMSKGNYTRRFDKEIMVLRYRDRELNK